MLYIIGYIYRLLYCTRPIPLRPSETEVSQKWPFGANEFDIPDLECHLPITIAHLPYHHKMHQFLDKIVCYS